ASAEALSYAVAHGVVGDPRAFKRPARVTVPRVLPTEDVLVVRKKAQKKGPAATPFRPVELPPLQPWKTPTTLEVIDKVPNGAIDELKKLGASVAVVVDELDDVRSVSEQIIAEDSPIRAVIAPYIPSQLVSALASEGIAS